VRIDRAITATVDRPAPAEQRAAWAHHLGADAGAAPSILAAQFDLGVIDIQAIAARGRRDLDSLWNACRERTRPALDALTTRVDPKAWFSDLVLPARELELLRQIAGQVRARARVYDDWGFRDRMNRGLGISALFSGESGTGKTMAAEVLANELSLDLYRIDLSAVVSKYIGETEKNLRQVFDAAEGGGAILFFDEADALFGRRSEVKDAHDRYANIEVSYLLQRMESYRGVAILATNMKQAMDTAFLRRLRFIVEFPFPAAVERETLWRNALPDGVPQQAIDHARLARLHLTGGNIHAIALNAAFLAARHDTPVTMRMLFDASRTELRKIGRPINEADLREAAAPEPARAAPAAHA
jgi:SpoVK/Ycf46/Vps4 family AAA+-type ATPase